MYKHCFGLGFVAVCLLSTPVLAEGFLFKEDREKLEAKGISFDIKALEDFVSIYKGGMIHKDTWMGRFDFGVTISTEKVGLYKGGMFHVSMMNAHGGLKPTADMIGDLQVVSNIEAPRSTRLYEGWYQQLFLDDKISALVGLHDMNADFSVSEYASVFINGAFGITPSISANTGASLYPMPAPGARLRISPNEHVDILTGIYDGNPGDPNVNVHSTHFPLNSKNGVFSIAEGQYHYKIPVMDGLSGTVKVGFWHNNRNVEDVSSIDDNGDPVLHDDNYGGYAVVDQMLYKENDDQGLGIFFMGGGAPQNRNLVGHHIAGGVNYTGLIPNRDSDVVGVAVTNSYLSPKFRTANDRERAETTVEVTYKARITDDLFIQPDIQYVRTPNGDKAIKNASVFTLRTEIHF